VKSQILGPALTIQCSKEIDAARRQQTAGLTEYPEERRTVLHIPVGLPLRLLKLMREVAIERSEGNRAKGESTNYCEITQNE
jgi:hypothetical protein